jgi:hypothetical protein
MTVEVGMDMMDIGELPPIRTKIVATLGPASRSPAVLRRLIQAGVDVFRLNFSHGTHEEHSAALAEVRAVSRELSRHVGEAEGDAPRPAALAAGSEPARLRPGSAVADRQGPA